MFLHSLTFAGLHAVTLAFRINLRTMMEVVPMAVFLNLCTIYSLIGLVLFSIESFGVSGYHQGIAASHHRQTYPPSYN